MCGIAGFTRLSSNEEIPHLEQRLRVMNALQEHRGPDGEGIWTHRNRHAGFAHRRLSIIDLKTGGQPMTDPYGNTICYNGEIYNYLELREELKDSWEFHTTSDTEVILAAWRKWGEECLHHLRGMFAIAIWDESRQTLFCARDRFGIKPFYYSAEDDLFAFASEAKALLPFVADAAVDRDAMKDYLVFQFCLEGKTLFKNIRELLPAHSLTVRNGKVTVKRYWEVYYHLDTDHTPQYFEKKLRELLLDSVNVHLRSDVPVDAYLSGGVDSSIVASLAATIQADKQFKAFHGRFLEGENYDESAYARAVADEKHMNLHIASITSRDFIETIRKVIYHLDFPVAGPGSFPQYHVSKLAAEHSKVVLGGQGGDEIFGGYVRYLVAYFEQCIKGAIEGSLHKGNFIVTYESIIPNLVALRQYKPLLQEFWREGLFETIDRRYFRLINRAPTLADEIDWPALGDYSPFDTFEKLFNGNNVGKESYFDKMTHFDFKTLLPALLQVEDRMSMAHGLESRVPFLDHPVVEFAATMQSDVKFKDGMLKRVLVSAMKDHIPEIVLTRKNKMGFPVPLTEWMAGDLKGFFHDIFSAQRSRSRPYFHTPAILDSLTKESQFGRKIWGLLSLELWYQEFPDKHAEYRALLNKAVDGAAHAPRTARGTVLAGKNV